MSAPYRKNQRANQNQKYEAKDPEDADLMTTAGARLSCIELNMWMRELKSDYPTLIVSCAA
eukprot:9108219-Pyramimonas_sp.AAC.1